MVSFKLDKNKKQEVTISTATIIRVLVSVLIFLLLIAFLRKITYALLLIVLAFFLALALNAPVQWLAKRLPHRRGREHRTLATIISFLIVIIVLGGFIASITPPIINQTQNFIDNVPTYVNDVQDQNSEFSRLIDRYHLQPEVQDFSNQLKSRLSNFTGSAVSVLSSVAESVVAVLTVLVLTFLMLIEGPRWLRFAFQLLPDKHAERANSMMLDMYGVVRGYVNGQVILAAIAAALIAPALFILHISYPVALMFVIFVCGLVPFVGHTIGAVVVTLVALFHSPLAAVVILAYYILYINIENYVIQPRLQAFTTKMSPLTVFVSVIVGVSFGGVIGGLLAIPVAGCLKVLVIDYLDRKDLVNRPEVVQTSEPAEVPPKNLAA